MRRIVFITNGHGETAIAARIAAEMALIAGPSLALDLFPLVGTGDGAGVLRVVGPRRAMPSGGLVAMGNVRAFSRDVVAGFAGLFARQLAFLRELGRGRDAVVAVGDAYALAFAFGTRLPAYFVGTAKSVYVAPYGPFERFLLRRARRVFVRDEATAERLRTERVASEAPGNVIADLASAGAEDAPPGEWLGILPGSREDAYADGVRLARVLRALGRRRPGIGGLVSVAPTLSADRMQSELAADGWRDVGVAPGLAFELTGDGTRLAGWSGDLGALLEASTVVLGQAGTANEQAAAWGVPVVALDRAEGAAAGGGADWYRMRQRRLLGDALALVPPDPERAADEIAALVADPERMRRMREAGRARMGVPGGAAAIARAVLDDP